MASRAPNTLGTRIVTTLVVHGPKSREELALLLETSVKCITVAVQRLRRRGHDITTELGEGGWQYHLNPLE